MKINELLYNKRIEKNLTMKQVADAVGVSEGTISRWESGRISNMRRDKIAKLSSVLDIPVETLMGRDCSFENPSKKYPLSDKEIKLVLRYRSASSGIRDAVDKLLDLRHTCASMLHAKGYPDKYIQARTGHASDEVLRRVYTHVLTNERQKIESEIVNDFEALLS